jgi:hypothetical protein
MTKTIAPPVQNEVAGQVAAMAPRDVVLAGLNFAEAFEAASKSAHWADVLFAADGLKNAHDDAAKAEKSVSAIARRIGATAPVSTARFRFAIVSYSLSGRTANDTQRAELSAKLPALKKQGMLRDNEITYGGLVLPKLIGNL